MLSVELTSYKMELGSSDLFTIYEMELETHAHAQMESNQGFMNTNLHAITRVGKL